MGDPDPMRHLTEVTPSSRKVRYPPRAGADGSYDDLGRASAASTMPGRLLRSLDDSAKVRMVGCMAKAKNTGTRVPSIVFNKNI